ncbi:MAG: hypothetical protein KAG97_11775 [Victivallales bacterium]|nr:hypothetical protein [Victivallales bacterium]
MRTEEVKAYAKSVGGDLFGVASIDRFEGRPDKEHPSFIFPECASVIVIGRRILRGALRGIEEGTNFSSTYSSFGHRYLEDNFLSKTTYDLTCRLEEENSEAVPLFGYSNDVDMAYGIPVAPDKPAPNVIVDIDFAAHQAGLGAVGKGGFFLTPEFGPRQRLAMILTDAVLEPSEIIELDFCEGCDDCMAGCPLNAISDDGGSDDTICASCANGAMDTYGRGGARDRLGAACARACVASLERRKKLSKKFNNPFRKREPWALDAYRRPITCPTGAQ